MRLSANGDNSAARLETAGSHLRTTRDLDAAKDYFGVRYAKAPEARYGFVASSRDTILAEWGSPNDYRSTKVMRLGPWYGDGEESHRSCRHLRECVTEPGAQGLELDGVPLAWGTDLVWEAGAGAEGAPGARSNAAPSATRARRTCATRSSCASTPIACCSPAGATGRSSSSRPCPSSAPRPHGCKGAR